MGVEEGEEAREIARLRDELEQTRTALEAANAQIGKLAVEREGLLLRLTGQGQDLQALSSDYADARVALSEQRTADEARQVVVRARNEEELRAAFTELQTVSEALEVSNTRLRQANLDLDTRVEQRTRQLAEANMAIRANEERLGLALSVGGLATWDWMLPTNEVNWSDEHYWMLGYRVGEVTPSFESWASRVHADDLEETVAAIYRARDHHEEYTHEFRVIWPSGVVRTCSARGRFYYDGDGRAVRMIGVMEDVTERQEADRALRQSEMLFRNFAAASSDILWIRNTRTLQFEFISPAFDRIYGDPANTLSDQNNFRRWARLILPEDRQGVMEAFRRVCSGTSVIHEFRIRRPVDGQIRWIRSTDFPLIEADAAIARIGGVAQDMTDQKEASDRMHVLVAELQHRTRNLITVVKALTQRTLAGSCSLDDFRSRFLDRIGALARVQGLLSRLEEGDRITFDELLEAELSGLGVADGHADQVTIEGPKGVRLRSSTVQTFALALHELATNALKYGALSQADGRLDIRWSVAGGTDDAAPRLQLDWRETCHVPQVETAETPRRKGYGRELIERALPYQLKATTQYELSPSGVRCSISLPLSETDTTDA
jgi:PAS domain S-box-containing protein